MRAASLLATRKCQLCQAQSRGIRRGFFCCYQTEPLRLKRYLLITLLTYTIWLRDSLFEWRRFILIRIFFAFQF